jgi:hypothetical protein
MNGGLRLFDGSGNDLFATSAGSPSLSLKFQDVGVYARGNVGTGPSNSAPYVLLQDVGGSNVRSNRQQVGLNESNSQIGEGVLVLEPGYLSGSFARWRIDHTLWRQNAHTQTIRLGGVFPPYVVSKVYCRTTVAYAGAIPTGPQMTVERFSQAAGSLIASHDVHTAVVDKGLAITDLGPDFQSGGVLTSTFGVVTSLGPAGPPSAAQYPTVAADYITVTMSAGGNLGTGTNSPSYDNGVTNFSAGSTDVIIEFSALPLG